MRHTFIATLLAPLALALAGCGGASAPGELRTLDLEAAIDNPRPFDLAEIATEIEFIPLDDSQQEGLVGEINTIAGSKNRFFVRDNGRESPIKIFDRTGRLLRTEGRFGRGPGEYTDIANFAVDPETETLYMGVRGGDASLVAYDSSGRELARSDSLMSGNMVFHDGKLLMLRNAMIRVEGAPQPTGEMKPFLDICSSTDLEPEATIDAPDWGLSFIMQVSGNMVNVMMGPGALLASDGRSALVKEALSDTLKRYRNGGLEPAFVLDPGGYAIPDGALGMNPSTELGNSYAVRGVMGGEGYLFVEAHGYRDEVTTRLVFDLDDPGDPSAPFSATGPDGRRGLFLDGIAFRPMYVRDGRLVGFMQAFDIADAAQGGATFTNPDLAALATTIKEDSNPVIVVATLRK